MKVISFSLFGDPTSFEFPFYLRGLYYNFRMNRLLYPEWRMFVAYSYRLEEKYGEFIKRCSHYFRPYPSEQLCKSMLWRMLPLWWPQYEDGFDVTHVISRDADAITTYKEAQAVQEWVDSGLGFHGITDNPAHGLPMMGGMVGFRVDHFRQTFPQWTSFEQMIKGFDLSQRGSDQDFMMNKIWRLAKDNMMGHFFDGCRETVKITRHSVSNQIPGVDPKLWESNLTCRHIGSAGVVDFETLRFFKRFDKTDYSEFEKEFKDILYWSR